MVGAGGMAQAYPLDPLTIPGVGRIRHAVDRAGIDAGERADDRAANEDSDSWVVSRA